MKSQNTQNTIDSLQGDRWIIYNKFYNISSRSDLWRQIGSVWNKDKKGEIYLISIGQCRSENRRRERRREASLTIELVSYYNSYLISMSVRVSLLLADRS